MLICFLHGGDERTALTFLTLNELAIPGNAALLQWCMGAAQVVPLSILQGTFVLFDPRFFPLHALACTTWIHWRSWGASSNGTTYSGKFGRSLAVMALTFGFVGAAKILVDGPRPEVLLPGLAVRLSADDPYGFPSGHAALAASICLLLWPATKLSGKCSLSSMVAWVALARCIAGLHFPADVAVGILLALIAFGVCRSSLRLCS